MKKLIFLSLVLLTVSCQTIDEGLQEYRYGIQKDLFLDINEEWYDLYKQNPSCDEWETKLKQFSKRFKKHGDMDEERNLLRIAKLYTDFKILFIQGRYAEAYAMGMPAYEYVKDIPINGSMKHELAITAKILDRFPEFEQKVEPWKYASAESIRSGFEFTVNYHCDDSLKQMGILEWAETIRE